MTTKDSAQRLRDSLDHLDRILEAAEAVKCEIENALEECEDEPLDTVREILNGVHLGDLADIEGGYLDLKDTLS
ncbi:MAG: hypothetical protein ACO3PY_05135 [Pontimonas sp.]